VKSSISNPYLRQHNNTKLKYKPHEQEMNSLKAAIQSSEKWPVSKRSLATKYYKLFTDSIVINKEQGHM
jgi:hypothetical protein